MTVSVGTVSVVTTVGSEAVITTLPVMGRVAVTTPVTTCPVVMTRVSVMSALAPMSNRASASGSWSGAGSWLIDGLSNTTVSPAARLWFGKTAGPVDGVSVGVAMVGISASNTSVARLNGKRVIPRTTITTMTAARAIVRRAGRRAGISACPQCGHTVSEALARLPHCRQRMMGVALG